MIELNETHDPALRSWVTSANLPGCDFPIQNLPFGVFSLGNEDKPRIGVAIGDRIFDIAAARFRNLFQGLALEAAVACEQDALNDLMNLGREHAGALRLALSRLLRTEAGDASVAAECLVPMADATMHLPARIANYTDFYTSIHHATNAGKMVRPENPLLSNFRSLPVAYHGRASTISVSGTPCIRPHGQSLPSGATEAVYGPTRKLDYELEVGIFIGRGNALGRPIPIGQAEQHVFGLCLFNDWSARDVQRWESQPLGPFLGKSFLSSVSPWVVTMDALAPFRSAAADRGVDAPMLLPNLDCPANRVSGAVDIALEARIQTARMREEGIAAHPVSHPNFVDQYWTIAQMVAHHTENGCRLMPGDLLGSGTVSGPRADQLGCLLELTRDASRPLALPGGEQRTYLEDGDDIIFRAHCRRDGFVAIGFGECVGRVVPALPALT